MLRLLLLLILWQWQVAAASSHSHTSTQLPGGHCRVVLCCCPVPLHGQGSSLLLLQAIAHRYRAVSAALAQLVHAQRQLGPAAGAAARRLQGHTAGTLLQLLLKHLTVHVMLCKLQQL
jgi:hypothetical protein